MDKLRLPIKKITIGQYPYLYPVPTVLLGSFVQEGPNYCTIGNCGIVSVHPPLVYASSDKSNYTNSGIREHGVVSLNIPSTAQLVETDYCGISTGAKTDKSEVFKSFYGSNAKLPMIDECPINIACSVIKTIELYDMEMFIAEIIESYASEKCMVDGKPQITKIDPIIYSIRGNYWSVGNEIGYPFRDGKKYGGK